MKAIFPLLFVCITSPVFSQSFLLISEDETGKEKTEYKLHDPIVVRTDYTIDGVGEVDEEGKPKAQVNFLWRIPSTVKWLSPSKGVVYVWAPKGTYSMELWATGINWETRFFDQKQLFKEIKVGKEDPGPDPGPDPDPNPDPPAPDSKYGLIKFSYNLIAKLPSSDRIKQVTVVMPDGNSSRVSAVEGVAAAYNEAALLIEDGTIISSQNAINKVKELTKDMLGTDPGQWGPVFFTPLSTKFSELYNGGEIRNVEDFSVAFKEVRDGLVNFINK